MLPCRAIGWDVAQVVDEQHRDSEEPDTGSGEPHLLIRDLGLQPYGSDRRHHAKEHKHDDFAEPRITVRAFASGVEPRGDDRDHADGDEPPPLAQNDRDKTSDGGETEEHHRSDEYPLRVHPP